MNKNETIYRKIDGFKTVSGTKSDKIKNTFKKVGLAMNKRKLLSDFPIIDRQCVIAELFPMLLLFSPATWRNK